MPDTDHITVYVSPEERTRIKNEADDQGVNLSRYFIQAVEEKWEREDTETAASRMDAEEKLERIVQQGRQELEATARQTEQRVDALADMIARSGAYSVANFELLKYQHGPPEGIKTNALQVGSRRLRAPMTDHPDLPNRDLDSDADTDDTQDDSEPLTVENVEQADDAESEDDDDEELTAAKRFFEGRGRSKEEADETRW